MLTSAAASVLLIMGGLGALQTAAIIFAAPFLLVMVGLCVSLWKALRQDRQAGPAYNSPAILRSPAPSASD
ncbi:BCCT family transporter [compost metagenome]